MKFKTGQKLETFLILVGGYVVMVGVNVSYFVRVKANRPIRSEGSFPDSDGLLENL